MKSRLILGGISLGLLLVACQSAPKPPAEVPKAPSTVVAPSVAEPTPPPPPPPAAIAVPDRIEASREGFSPLASPPNHTLTLSIHWSNPEKLTEWAILFVSEGEPAVRTIRGTDPVPTVDWDGKTDAGVLAAHGRYQAVLQTKDGEGTLVERARTLPFLLDIVPPSGTITIAPVPFVLGPPSIIVDPPSVVTIQLNLTSGDAPWTTWRLAVIHPDGRTFRGDFISEDHRDNQIVWDARAINNAQLEAGVVYRVEAEVYDIWGNKSILSSNLPVEAPPAPVSLPVEVPEPAPPVTTMTVTLDGALLAEFPLFFPPYSADLGAVTGSQRTSNEQALGRLSELVAPLTGKKIVVVGHANQVFYQDPLKAAYEQKETLLPLSLARANAVKQALVTAGVSADAMETQGVGAGQPLVPFSDAENRWKNRRVELELSSD